MTSSGSSFDLHAFCALPLVRRVYHALVVGLAVFLATLVMLHEPFRGYLAEVQMAGPAIEGLNLEKAVAWLKQADPQAAVIAVPAGEVSPKSQLRATYVARRPEPAEKRLDDLAQRWLYQYLPDRLQAYRRATVADLRTAVQQAREREDAADQRLQSLHYSPVATAAPALTHDVAPAIAKPSVPVMPASEPAAMDRAKSREKLELLRLELSRLMVSCTEAHPEVITIRSQISALEHELGIIPGQRPPQSGGPALLPADANHSQTSSPRGGYAERRASHLVATSASSGQSDSARPKASADLVAQWDAASREKSQASRERQAAEHRLTDRLQELSTQPTSAQWSAMPARVVTRLGGTPRSSTLLLGGMLACVASAVMFRAAGGITKQPCIHTTGELATALELPVIATIGPQRKPGVPRPGRWGASSVQAVLFASEAIVAVAAMACVVAMLIEPSLSRQVLADPFGTLSEVIERFSL